MFDELDTIVLKKDNKKYNLKEGDIGTVVHIYDGDEAVEVEFVKADGKTVAVLTLRVDDIRKIAKNEMLHVRGLSPAYSL